MLKLKTVSDFKCPASTANLLFILNLDTNIIRDDYSNELKPPKFKNQSN